MPAGSEIEVQSVFVQVDFNDTSALPGESAARHLHRVADEERHLVCHRRGLRSLLALCSELNQLSRQCLNLTRVEGQNSRLNLCPSYPIPPSRQGKVAEERKRRSETNQTVRNYISSRR